jgi:hypothetical protein
MPNAYEAMQGAAGVTEFAEKAQVHARSTGNQRNLLLIQNRVKLTFNR